MSATHLSPTTTCQASLWSHSWRNTSAASSADIRIDFSSFQAQSGLSPGCLSTKPTLLGSSTASCWLRWVQEASSLLRKAVEATQRLTKRLVMFFVTLAALTIFSTFYLTVTMSDSFVRLDSIFPLAV